MPCVLQQMATEIGTRTCVTDRDSKTKYFVSFKKQARPAASASGAGGAPRQRLAAQWPRASRGGASGQSAESACCSVKRYDHAPRCTLLGERLQRWPAATLAAPLGQKRPRPREKTPETSIASSSLHWWSNTHIVGPWLPPVDGTLPAGRTLKTGKPRKNGPRTPSDLTSEF